MNYASLTEKKFPGDGSPPGTVWSGNDVQRGESTRSRVHGNRCQLATGC
jgi:hypothetical protein